MKECHVAHPAENMILRYSIRYFRPGHDDYNNIKNTLRTRLSGTLTEVVEEEDEELRVRIPFESPGAVQHSVLI